jgi:cytochrome c-type biogenesis protein CcmH/NrfG
MTTTSSTISKQNFYLGLLVALIIGFLAGVGFTVFKTGDEVATSTPSQQRSQTDVQNEAIATLEAEVAANPEDFQSWTRLGHLYFDTSQYQKAIAAYNKSLSLHSGSADLWTDLGVMYRRAGQPQKALESFTRAQTMDSSHLPSRFNMGVVLHFDLDRTEDALASWRQVVAINPEYRTANGILLAEFVGSIEQQRSTETNQAGPGGTAKPDNQAASD